MKFRLPGVALSVALLGIAGTGTVFSADVEKEDCFYLKSLHYTAAGMEYWYSAENGGLEQLTGIPYDDLTCKNCHAGGCDRCHKVERQEKDCTYYEYSTDAASKQKMCLGCHGREGAMIRINHKKGQDDVHLSMGMVCVDCHSGRELHGDGTSYVSLKQPGAMDTQCENCHDDVKTTESHTVHNGRLDCKACHIRHVVSCTNCHFDTMVEEGKRKAIPVSGWVFLMNYEDKVTSASMQTFVVGKDKTFLIFAPHMSHAVMKEGRHCEGCHATDIMKRLNEGSLVLTDIKAGEVVNTKGVIPVVDKVDYRCVYLDRNEEGEWVPIDHPADPIRQYVAFGEPLTPDQVEKMSEKQKSPLPKMGD